MSLTPTNFTNKIATKLLFACAVLFLSTPIIAANEEKQIVVIAHNDFPYQILTKQQIKRLFLGDSRGLGANTQIQPINLPYQHRVRTIFSNKVIGLSEARVKAYWAQMKFAGKGKPPKEVDSSADAINMVLSKSGYIAYIPMSEVKDTDDLKVLYVFNE